MFSLETYANPVPIGPNDFAGDLDWSFVVRGRKGECQLPSNREWGVGFNKQTTSTYVLYKIIEGTLAISLIYGDKAGFPVRFPSICVLPILQHAQNCLLLLLR